MLRKFQPKEAPYVWRVSDPPSPNAALVAAQQSLAWAIDRDTGGVGTPGELDAARAALALAVRGAADEQLRAAGQLRAVNRRKGGALVWAARWRP